MVALSNGILFFAYNNETINYAEIANINAMLIKKHMENNNISVITDEETKKHLDPSLYDHIIINKPTVKNMRTFVYADKTETVTWKNTTRASAYDLTPYDNTLLLDVDYLIFNGMLDRLFSLPDLEFSSAEYSMDLPNYCFRSDKVGDIHMLWATMIYFKKCYTAELYFDYMTYVRDNYEYFSQLYGFTVRNFRNDYALTIANKEINTWTDKMIHTVIPFIYTMPLTVRILDFSEDSCWHYVCNVGDESKPSQIRNMSLHVMNKHDILKFKDKLIDYATSTT